MGTQFNEEEENLVEKYGRVNIHNGLMRSQWKHSFQHGSACL